MQDSKQELGGQKSKGAPNSTENRAASNPSSSLTPLAHAERFNGGEKGADEQPDDQPLNGVAQGIETDTGKRLLYTPARESAHTARGGIEKKLFPRNVTRHGASSHKALRVAPERSSAPRLVDSTIVPAEGIGNGEDIA
ncbi:MAG: hypothetical protein ACXWNU_00390 [Candidatus Binataceae bacterium]